MTMQWKLAGAAALGALALHAVPAAAEVRASTHEVHAYAGYLFGDDLTDTDVSGRQPELDDDVVYGLRYGYNITNAWGIELSAGYNPNSVTGVAGGDIDLDLTTVDLNAIWHFDTGARWTPYLTAGVGYAWADLDRSISGTVNDQDVSIDDDDGFTMNAGGGVKFFPTDQFMIRLDGRYRYVDTLADRFDDALNTWEATLGVGWRF